jgi:uncharacterized protein YecT (DUF1311 family)
MLMCVWLSALPCARPAEPKRLVLVTAPSGDFQLTAGDRSGAIRLVPAKNPDAHVALPPAQVKINDESGRVKKTKLVSSDSLESQRQCFISPDENWIFVQMPTDNNCSTGILYRRQNPASGNETFNYQLAMPEAFEKSAWQFFSKERKVPEDAIGVPDQYGNRYQNIEFGGWSSDSARLLVALSGDIGKPKEPEEGGPAKYQSSASTWLLYFNTRTGKFEQTDRLRSSNALREKAQPAESEKEVENGAVLSAESLGQEGPEVPVKDRLRKADAALNQTYQLLLKQLSSDEKTKLQQEQRSWLTERDTFSVVYAIQSWSPFPNASQSEGASIITEKRVAELQQRLKQNDVSANKDHPLK